LGEVVRDKILSIAADVLSISPGQLTEQSSPKNVESWDSIRHLNLVLALEDRFALQFEPEEMEQMETIGKITSLVEAKLGAIGKS
jgi:acyl carrier protein